MTLLKLWIQKHEIPMSVYCDKKNAYQLIRPPTVKEHLEGIEPASVFERACAQLCIEIIPSHSPQAKGRIERNNRMLQDRFVKELQLEESTAIEDVNSLCYAAALNISSLKPVCHPRSAKSLFPSA